MTFGFDTAVQVATDAIDRLHTTAESHNRVMVVEVMGRHAGWIALHSGIAGGADVILVPEQPFDIDEVCRLIRRRHDARAATSRSSWWPRARTPAGGHDGASVAGGEDEFGHVRLGGIGQRLEQEIESAHRLRDARHRPRPHPARRHADRVRPRARHAPRRGGDRRRARAATGAPWRRCAATEIELVPLAEAVAELRTVPRVRVRRGVDLLRLEVRALRGVRRLAAQRCPGAASRSPGRRADDQGGVSRKASNALMPKAHAVIHQTRPTVSATRTAMRPATLRQATRRRILVKALNAPFIARSAPEPSPAACPPARERRRRRSRRCCRLCRPPRSRAGRARGCRCGARWARTP